MFRKHLAALTAGLALAFGLAAGAQAAITPAFTFEGQNVLDLPSNGTIVAGAPLIEGTRPGTADNVSGLSGIERPGSRQLLLDNGLGEDVFGVGISLVSWAFDFTLDQADTFVFGWNFATNVQPGTGEDFFQVELLGAGPSIGTLAYVDTLSGTFMAGGPLGWQTGASLVSTALAAGSYTVQFTLGTSQAGCLPGATSGACIPSLAIVNAVPEPATLALVTLALGGVVLPAARRRARQAALVA